MSTIINNKAGNMEIASRLECFHQKYDLGNVTTPCSLSQCDEFIMVTWQSDKFQCIIVILRFLTAYSFFKASPSGNKSIVAGR